MRSKTPTIHCDADDGFCGAWDVDNFEIGASSVNGTRVTDQHRSPGWVSDGEQDLCPEHAKEK